MFPLQGVFIEVRNLIFSIQVIPVFPPTDPFIERHFKDY